MTAARDLSRRPLVIACLCLLTSLTSYLQAVGSRGGFNMPPENGGDADSYERLGWNLAAGLGFGYCPGDSEIIAGRAEPTSSGECVAGCETTEFSPTAYRPPGFPLLIAIVNLVSPLNFAVVRIINCVCCALAVAISVYSFSRWHSPAAGLLGGLLCSIDPRVREFAGTFLTENLATLLLTAFIVLLAQLCSRRTIGAATLAGLAFSVLVLVRSFYVAWYPILWLWMFVDLLRRHKVDAADSSSSPRLRAMRVWLAFAVCSIALTVPWWIRNCVVLDALMPTGTQGGIGIADGFSDSAMRNFGSWSSTTADSIAADMRQQPEFATLSPIEFEREHSRLGAIAASAWMRSHTDMLLQLSWWKLSRLWELSSVVHSSFFSIVFAGLFLMRHQPASRVMFGLLVLNSLTVIATYHTYERFQLPFRPLMHGFAAAAIVSCCTAIRSWLIRRPSC